MAMINIKVDVTGTALEDIFRRGYHSIEYLIDLVIINYRPEELDGYENYRMSNCKIGGMDSCIVEATIRCRKIRRKR